MNAHHEHGRLVTEAVGGGEQRAVACEELVQSARRNPAGENQGIGPLLLVAPIHHAKEPVRARPVERTPPCLRSGKRA